MSYNHWWGPPHVTKVFALGPRITKGGMKTDTWRIHRTEIRQSCVLCGTVRMPIRGDIVEGSRLSEKCRDGPGLRDEDSNRVPARDWEPEIRWLQLVLGRMTWEEYTRGPMKS